MNSLLFRLPLRFQAKVLLPVMSIMVMLVGITVWLVNRSIVNQVEAEAAQRLNTAQAVFRNSQKIRSNNLLLRYRNVLNDPRFKAVSQPADPKTMRFLLSELLDEYNTDFILFTTESGRRLASAGHDPTLNLTAFDAESAASITQALDGQADVETVSAGGRLFDIASLPVSVGDNIVGVLTFGAEIGDAAAQEFRQLTHAEIAFLSHNHVVASTLQQTALRQQFDDLVKHSSSQKTADNPLTPSAIHKVLVDDEHFLYAVDSFSPSGGNDKPHYLLLCSYEQPLRSLHKTQRQLMGVGFAGILVASLIVWALVRKITEPLRLLRDSAEAVGRGDFTHHVVVTSRDECGQLAEAFNHMTGNLKTSREQLEQTVETLKTTKAQLTQSERLSAVGEFVAGVTHELNNPLTSVIGFAQLLQRKSVDEQQQRYLERVVNEAQRCHRIVQSLLSFARQHSPERKLLNLNEAVEAAVDILHYHLRTSNIEVIAQLDPQLPAVMADGHQLQQVFVNLLNNARQAIEAHQAKGWVRISTEKAGDHARVTIQDSGPGISKENMGKIFTPFFTTKEVGKGTGLGLSLCYGIVQEHSGSITVQSKPGEGATFTIELPVASATANSLPATDQSPTPAENANPGRGKKVLVVDDEQSVTDLIREVLSAEDYQVDTSGDGETALRKLGRSHYDLVVCDMKMPGLDGSQVYERLRASDPDAARRFMFMTGDVVGDKTRQFFNDSATFCLSKPFSLDEFRATVGKVIGSNPPARE